MKASSKRPECKCRVLFSFRKTGFVACFVDGYRNIVAGRQTFWPALPPRDQRGASPRCSPGGPAERENQRKVEVNTSPSSWGRPVWPVVTAPDARRCSCRPPARRGRQDSQSVIYSVHAIERIVFSRVLIVLLWIHVSLFLCSFSMLTCVFSQRFFLFFNHTHPTKINIG